MGRFFDAETLDTTCNFDAADRGRAGGSPNGLSDPPILTQGRHGTMLLATDVHEAAGFASPVNGTVQSGAMVQVFAAPPQCVDGTWWWQINDGQNVWGGWMPEMVDGQAVVKLFAFQPATPVAVDVPMRAPVMTTPDVPLPTVNPATTPPTLDVPFTTWDWASATRRGVPDRARSADDADAGSLRGRSAGAAGRFEQRLLRAGRRPQRRSTGAAGAKWVRRRAGQLQPVRRRLRRLVEPRHGASRLHHHRRAAALALPDLPERADVP